MVGERVERRLTAIVAADVAGYSRLMGADEEGTLAQLKAHRQDLLDPKINEHRGRIVKTTGDGLLVEFASVVNALHCAIAIQRGMVERNAGVGQEKRLELRIGINVGDIIIDDDDIYGDGVNVAARLEGMAEPGGICVSGRVQEDVRGKLDALFEDAGERQLKNIARPVRAYRIRFGGEAATVAAGLPLPDRPSIAVLRFQNMSGDPEQEYFADGVVEDVISALSRIRWLFVIARNSSFTYSGNAVDVKQVGRALGVRYVLEGSVRKAANRVRITGQLIDATTATHLWADRFEGTLDDIFELQDQMTQSVVGAIAPQLEQAEIERAKRKPTASLDAYDCYLRGRASLNQGTRAAVDEGLPLLYRAIELDPDFAPAYAMAAWCVFWRKVNGWMTDRTREIAEGARLARRAVELGKDDAVALTRGGHALAHFTGDLDAGIALLDKALALDPNLAAAWFLGGFLRAERGEPDDAMAFFERAMRFSPLDPEMFRMQAGMALAHLLAGRLDDASSWAEKACRDLPSFLLVAGITAASHALAGRIDQAQRAMHHVRELDPALRLSTLEGWLPFRRPEDRATFADGLRRAGLPE
jgi:TolB-like protein/class 3 adenylate cyclase/tetratricopeptide (TPR) repeat protein